MLSEDGGLGVFLQQWRGCYWCICSAVGLNAPGQPGVHVLSAGCWVKRGEVLTAATPEHGPGSKAATPFPVASTNSSMAILGKI